MLDESVLQNNRYFTSFISKQQARPNEIELGCQYFIKTHGKKLLRDHMHDWLILILLVFIEIGLNVIHPFYRFVGEDMMTDLRYPFQDNTVPVWAVPVSSFNPSCAMLFLRAFLVTNMILR